MDLTTLLLLVGGTVFGGLATYVVTTAQRRGQEEARAERERNLNARSAQLEAQLSQREGELEVAREEISRLATNAAAAEARLEEQLVGLRQKVEFVEEARNVMAESFKGLASDALKSNNESFLDLARESLTRYQEAARTDLESRQRSIGEMLSPVRETLSKVHAKIDEVEKERIGAHNHLTSYLDTLSRSQAKLEAETANLVKALRSPSVRGRWGEIQLRRVVEMAGMVQYCDFVEQPTIEGETGKLRPDLIVQLPNERSVVVDSKTPLHHYLQALEAGSDDERRAALQDHARLVRTHLQQLGTKGYWERLDASPEFVVLFLPGEAFFSAALEQDPELIQYGVDQRVIMATPTTLIALLKAIAYGWKQEQLADSAREISDLGRELSDRLASFVKHFQGVKTGLDRAVASYNKAVGSLESRVLVSARRFDDLGSGGAKEISPVEEVVSITRALHAPEAEGTQNGGS